MAWAAPVVLGDSAATLCNLNILSVPRFSYLRTDMTLIPYLRTETIQST